MTEHTNHGETSNPSGADFDALRGRLEESLVLGCADWDPEWASNPDDVTLTFAQRLAKAGHFSEDIDNAPTSENDTEGTHQDNLDQPCGTRPAVGVAAGWSHPMQCLCVECCPPPPTNDSFYAGAIGDRKVISPNTRPYNVTLKNINPQIVSAIIGKRGAVQKQLVREFYLRSLHISEPEDKVLDSGRTVSSCNIVLIGHNRDNVMAATKKVVTILKREEELYIEVDYMDYRTHQRAFI